MKIAHISIIPAFSPGIFKKLEDKARISIENNLDFDFYLLNPKKEFHQNNLHVIKKSYDYIPSAFIRTILFRLFKLKNLDKYIELEKYDAIILRYPLIDGIGNNTFLKKYGYKIYTEHHTDEISELFAVGRIVDKIRGYLEILFAKSFLSKIKGIIAVTDEIRMIELKKVSTEISSLTVANGINPNSYKKTTFLPFDEKKLKMIFVASEFAPWHGLEFFLEKLIKYEGLIKLELHLVGSLSGTQKEIIKKINSCKILTYGKLYSDELDDLMSTMNIAISSLALSKNNMKEACTLKSREYIVRGLPFFYAYKDTDLNGDESFAKRFEEDNISLENVIDFTNFVSKNRKTIESDMEKYVDIISWKNKLIKIKEFVEND
jgi:hypothetical protein